MVGGDKKQKRKSLVRSFARTHGIFTLLIFMFYVAFAMLGNFDMLAKDLEAKYTWAASTNVSLYILSMPNKPVINAASDCVNDAAVMRLAWNVVGGADYYDILRDGQILASGVSGTSFVDNIVSAGESYTYVVIAQGLLGSTASLPVTALVETCSITPPSPPDPQCQIMALDGSPIDFSLPVKTENNLPKISGTTNMANAIIMINIFPGPIVSSTTTAQNNGFWEYSVFSPLPVGVYAFQVTAIDSQDSSRSITKSVQIEIIEAEVVEEEPGDDEEEDGDGVCGNEKRIVLCHQSGTPAQETITVDHSSVNGHLRHGDYCGACRVKTVGENSIEEEIAPPNPTDDGDEETDIPVDILSNPEKNLPLMMTTEIVNKNKIIYSNQDLFIQVFLNWKKASPQKTDLVYEIVNERGQVVSSMVKNNGAATESIEQIIPLPGNIEYGTYIVRLRTKINGMYITSQDSFVYREAPIVNLGGSITLTYSELVSGIGWFAIVCLLLMAALLAVLTHEYYLYSGALRTVTGKGLEKNGLISKRKGVSP
jgi:hypothetical protein